MRRTHLPPEPEPEHARARARASAAKPTDYTRAEELEAELGKCRQLWMVLCVFYYFMSKFQY